MAARAFLFLLAAMAGCASGGPEISREARFFRVTGLTAAETSALSVARWSAEEWNRVFSVQVANNPQISLFGDHRMQGGALVFESRYPPSPGMEYRAILDRSAIPGGSGPRIERTFTVPPRQAGPPTTVRLVTPTRDVLPENLLKFYLYFSAPMARGEAYRRVHLQESNGKEVGLPFLELGEELWDHSGTRITLFFDPGRIKRELRPREEIGPSLEEGKSYVLVIDRDWQDAEGRPLERGHRKAFKVVAPDERQPDPAKWTITPPRAGSLDPLVVQFDEPLDHAMLGRVLEVAGGVQGRIEIDAGETRWRFHPEQSWPAGRHGLKVDTLLEDLAGNSIAKPFEVDVFRPIERKVVSKTMTLPFDTR